VADPTGRPEAGVVPGRLRVAVADDAMLLREGIGKVLADGGLDVVASVGSGDELVAAVEAGGVDVAVLDIRMPPNFRDEGIVALETLRATGSSIGVLLLSMYATPEYAMRVMGIGAGPATCSRSASPSRARSSAPWRPCRSADPSSTPRWWRS
jgi:DNA-binding NarL/FixJ family response regulator